MTVPMSKLKQRWARRTAIALLPMFAGIGLSGCAHPGFLERLKTSQRLARESEPLQYQPAHAIGSILIVGDSTGVGTGAPNARQSVAGRLAQQFPATRIRNLAADGARLRDLIGQLADEAPRSHDLVLVMAAGNDVIRFTTLSRLRDEATQVTLRATTVGRQVIWLPSGNVGAAPIWPWPIDRLMTWRSRQVRELLREIAVQSGAQYIDLYKPTAEDPFAIEPARYLAADGLHPNAEGYAYWTEALLRGLPASLNDKWTRL